MRSPWFAVILLTIGCDSTSTEADVHEEGDAPIDSTSDEIPSTAPAAPDFDDPLFSVMQHSDWLLVGDGLTPEDTSWTAAVTAPAGVTTVEAWIDGVGPQVTELAGDHFDVNVDVTGMAVGTYQVVLGEPGSSVGFAARTFRRSNAYYVIMATDWDDADNADALLDNMDVLRARHPELRYTHYFGPYTLTDPAVTEPRRAELVSWITTRRDDHGDEIGVHLHPRCTFVDTTSVTCRTEPSDVYAAGDPSGYTVIVASYTVEEMTTLLIAAADIFEASGLGRPTSFRAGGWTTDEGTLEAIVAAGYTMDADAIVASRIEEWDGLGNGVFYDWLMEHWGDITINSQPYWPSLTDASVPADPSEAFGVLQVPANAVIVDYVTSEELTEIFEANWPGHEPLGSPTIWHTGLHPPNFSGLYMNTLDGPLNVVDLYLHSSGTGPVVYATAGEMTAIAWP